MINIRLFGVPQITVEDQRLDEFHDAPTLLHLFCFLLTYQERTHHRRDLAARLWPECEEVQAAQRLSNILWRLRKALGLGSTLLQIERNTVRITLPEDSWLDVEAFARLTATLSLEREGEVQPFDPAWEEAYALYGGEYLHGIEEDWVQAVRQHWQARYVQLAERLISGYRQAGRLLQALSTAQQLLAVEPYHEAGHAHLIELYLALNQREQARAHFQHVQRIWREELHSAPSLAIQALAARHQLDLSVAADSLSGTLRSSAWPVQTTRSSPLRKTPEAYLRREIEICCKSDELYDLQTERVRQRENLGRLQGLVTQLNESTATVDYLGRQAWLATRQGEYGEALTAAQRGLRLAIQSNNRGQSALMHRLLGVASEEMGNFQAAHHHYARALSLDEMGEPPALIATDLNNLASVHLTTGDSPVALTYLQRAQKLLINTPAATVQTKVVGNRGFAYLQMGQLDQAEDSLRQAALLAKMSGEQDAEWWITSGLIRLQITQGEVQNALRLAQQQLALLQTGGDACAFSAITELLALSYLALAEPKQALNWAQQTLHHAQQKQQWRYHYAVGCVLPRLNSSLLSVKPQCSQSQRHLNCISAAGKG